MLPRDDWSRFLEAFSLRHHGWLVRLETHDLVTREKDHCSFRQQGDQTYSLSAVAVGVAVIE
jgi:hypothetical protein